LARRLDGHRKDVSRRLGRKLVNIEKKTYKKTKRSAFRAFLFWKKFGQVGEKNHKKSFLRVRACGCGGFFHKKRAKNCVFSRIMT
jgi:hypothetical protein